MNIKDVKLDDTTFQTMPPLTDDEYRELKEDIRKHGVRVPIIFDSEGRCIDGHHRLRACKELNFEYFPGQVENDLSEQEKREMSRTLNTARRHLTQEQKQKILQEQLSETPEKSDRQIGEQLGVDHKTVGAARRRMESSGEIPQIDKTVGADGRTRATRSKNKVQEPALEDDQAEDDVDPEDAPEEVTEDETDIDDAGIGDDEDHSAEADDEDEESELPTEVDACCRAIRNGFQGLTGMVDIELGKLHESGKFDLYGGDVLEALSDGINALREREAGVREWGKVT